MKKQIGGDDEVAITSLTVYDPPSSIKEAYATYRYEKKDKLRAQCVNDLPDVCYALTKEKISQCVDELKKATPSEDNESLAKDKCKTEHKYDTSKCVKDKLKSLNIILPNETDALNKLGIKTDGTFKRSTLKRFTTWVKNTGIPKFTEELSDACINFLNISNPLENPIVTYRAYIKKLQNDYKPYLYDAILPNLTVDPENFKISLQPNSSNATISKANISTILSDKHIGIIIETNGVSLNNNIESLKDPSYIKIHEKRIIYIKSENQNSKYINTILSTNTNFTNALKYFLMLHLKLE